jgi:hypothetical protein
MLYVYIAAKLASLRGFKYKLKGDRFIYWNDQDTFSTLITDGQIAEAHFRRNIGGKHA